MQFEIKDFIGIFNNVYPDGYCKHLISEIDRLEHFGAGATRRQSDNEKAHNKQDFQIFGNGVDSIKDFNNENSPRIFFKGLQTCFNEYTEKYSILYNHTIDAQYFKLQKTRPGEGYHIWHGEKGDNNTSRVLVFMLYLNSLDYECAGETEFLYQQKRIKPVENTMLIWPAAFTHAHRGNVVHGTNNKYIVTGWFNIHR
jgi:hypothetical protein